MIGPTGVGKTEIARRLAKLIRAPFIKVEASRFTEVGYVGRDVESMIRDLVEVSYNIVQQAKLNSVASQAKENALNIILDKLVPPEKVDFPNTEQELPNNEQTRKKFQEKLVKGKLDDQMIEIPIVEKQKNVLEVLPFGGNENIDQIRDMISQIIPKNRKNKKIKIKDALRILTNQESENLINIEEIKNEAKRRAENFGIVFIDEFDKIAKRSDYGTDVSREGVQRDLLPLIEGNVVNTKYGSIKTDHILFIAAGAFHISKPSDLIPEIQGRFPIRVELGSLTKKDLYRVLKEPRQSLVLQYIQLLAVEGVKLVFTDSALKKLAEIAFFLNTENENIGARRLQALVEKTLEDINFASSDNKGKEIIIDDKYVNDQLSTILKTQDLSRYVL